MAPRKFLPNIQKFEERDLPSASYLNGTALTIDFTPDNTSLFNESSNFFATFQSNTKAAEAEILRAFQTWADAANINIGLITGVGPNSSTPFADAGMSSVIHVAAVPLSNGVGAISSPINSNSTNAGDMLLNSNQSFSVAGSPGTYDLYTVALHEAGILLGLPENSTKGSVMNSMYQGKMTGLSGTDKNAIQALYGPSVGTSLGGSQGINSASTAFNLGGGFQGTTITGQLIKQNQTDYYQFDPSQERTITLQTSGLSLFEGKLIVRDYYGHTIATATATDPTNGNLSLTIPATPGVGNYTVEVTGANNSVYGMGEYQLSLTTTPTTPVVTSISAQQTVITGTRVRIQVVATDPNNSNPAYSWATTAMPNGATTPKFDNVNGSNPTVTFYQPGTYTFTATVSDQSGLSTTSSVTVNVVQSMSSVSIAPTVAYMITGTTQQFAATALDQFGQPMASQPTFTWQDSGKYSTISSAGLLSANDIGNLTVTASAGGFKAQTNVVVMATPAAPTVTSAASAQQTQITGTSTGLQVQATDSDGANSSYSWAVTSQPAGARAPTFDSPNSNKCNVTFYQAGSYTLTATITDPSGLYTTSSVTVNVSQTLTSVGVTPNTPSLMNGTSQQFTATTLDQFGQPMASQPTAWTWAVNGAGTITKSGLFTANGVGNVTVTASAGNLNSQVRMAVTPIPTTPIVSQAASAQSTLVTGSSTGLQVQATNADGATPTYSWAVTSQPAGAPAPTFDYPNSSKCNVTFRQAGLYTLTVTVADPSGLSTTSSVNVTVAQTLTSISVTPGMVSLVNGTTQQFAAAAFDQFGQRMASQPTLSWKANGGSISSNGLFTANSVGNASVTASASNVNGQANLAVIPAPSTPTVTSPASAQTTLITGTSTSLKVQATNTNGATPSYMWSVTSQPAGAPTPTFDRANNNQNNVTFYQAGTYTLTATITDLSGLYTTSSVTITVVQTMTNIRLTPAPSFVVNLCSQQYSATALDQFGQAMASQPAAWTWSVNGGGTISNNGLFTANGIGNASVKVSSGLLSTQTNVAIIAAGNVNNVNLNSNNYSYSGNLASSSEVDEFNVNIPPQPNGAPQISTPVNITVSTPANAISPQIFVYDKSGNLIPSLVLAEDSGRMAIQIPTAMSGDQFVVYVRSGVSGTGAYNLAIGIASTPIQSAQVAGTLDATTSSAVGALDVTQNQAIQFVLSGNTTDNSTATALQLTIYNSQDQVVALITVPAGTAQTVDELLAPGIYGIQINAVSTNGTAIAPIDYQLSIFVVTNPIGVGAVNPTSNPTSGTPTAPPITGGHSSGFVVQTTPTGGTVLY